MKNLLIYINPLKNLDADKDSFRHNGVLAKVQIDNSFDLGWKKEDILLITNFPYEYSGIKSIVVDDNLYYSFRPLSNKTLIVSYLLEKNILEKGQIYWVHDFDAFQLNLFNDKELDLNNADIGFTDYGWAAKWSLGSYFFKSSSQDVFMLLKDTIYKYKMEDERALVHLTNNNTNNIKTRIKKLNITYNFGMRNVGHNYQIADKPLKVLHFHPYYRDTKMKANTIASFMYGKNELNMPLMNDRLVKIFKTHKIK